MPDRWTIERVLVIAIAAASFVIPSCTTSDQPPELVVSPEPEAPPAVEAKESTAAQTLQRIEAVTGTSGRLASEVADVRAMLKAQDEEARGDYAAATQSWFAALAVAKGKFGQKALEGWLKAYTKNLGKKSDRVVLARLVMAETHNGHHSPYMLGKGLTTDTALFKLLDQTVSEWLMPNEQIESHPPMPPPAAKGLPSDDPLLVKTAQKTCNEKRTDVAAWDAWLKSLQSDVKKYWEALLAPEALEAFSEIYPRLAQHKATAAMAVEVSGRIAALQRSIGLRTEAADTYLELIKAWARPGVTADAMGMEPVAFAIRRIDETLWGSRYRALVGDYENGKIFAQSALTLIANAYTKKEVRTADREALAALRAEAYHALAYRIAIERKEYDSALSLTLLALQSSNLSREWQERLSWFAALYDYLGGNFESAKKRWETMLTKTKDDSLRASTYFWLAKTYSHLDQKDQAMFYVNAVTEEYPLSYYSTIAPEQAGIKGGKDWREVFGSPKDLEKKLTQSRDYGLDRARRSKTIGGLLRRSEILAAANAAEWARLACDELDSAMAGELSMERDTGAYVYLTRLHYDAGNFLKAIGITTKLAKAQPGFWKQWPEQLLIYFPRPYHEIYDRNARDNTVDKELLLAISRQESGFTPEIRSSANALGLMQLIEPTARRFADELGMDTSNIQEQLKNPEANIRMGSRYLRFLSLNYKGFPPGIYGGYNAGEYAVDLWLKRRGHTDPLMFVELVPFQETKDYIKNVWRNVMVYRFIEQTTTPQRSLISPPSEG
jgi:tetratricopeptide (TPR) repeat protein